MKHFPCFSCIMLMVWTAPAIAAGPAHLSFEVVSRDTTTPVTSGVFTLNPSNTEQSGSPVVRNVEIPGSLTLDAPSERQPWHLSVDAEGYWFPTRSVVLEPNVRVSMQGWETARLEGTVTVPRGEAVPEELAVRFEPAVGSAKGQLPRSRVVCPVVEHRWACEVPAATVDLRLRATGFISHYFWGLDLQPGKKRLLGNLRLKRGASLVGRVEALEGPLPEKSVVGILPLEAASDENGRHGRLKHEVSPDAHGFFHATGIAPGAYRVTATYPGGAVTQLFPVQIMADAETELRHPLVMTPPLALEAVFRPKTDLAGKPWEVEILEKSSVPGAVVKSHTGRASREGVLRRPGLPPGGYALIVKDSTGSMIATHELELTPGTGPIEVELPLLFVEGTVHFGDDPLPATLRFGGQFGAEQVELVSDEDGIFAGALPRDGEWLIHVASEDPPIRRNLRVEVEEEDGAAELEIRLPATRITGRVVDTEDNPLQATVIAYDPALAEEVGARSDEDGRFELRGLPEGPNVLYAGSAHGISEELWIDVVEKNDPAPTLVVRPTRPLSGVVTGPHGPIPGALVSVREYEAGRSQPRRSAGNNTARTEVDGTFTLEISATTERLQWIAFPPGYTLQASPVGPVPDQIVVSATQEGGSVVFELEEPFDWLNKFSPRPSLWIDGVPVDFHALYQWARINSETPGNTFRIPALPPGSLRVCWSAPTSETFLGMPEHRVEECRDSFLAPGGEIRIQVDEDGGI